MTMDLRAGSEIGGYILESYIGGGSFGAVWRGHDAKTGAPVAIKLLTGAFSDNETSAMRANMELLAAAAARTSHHVVRVLAGGVDPIPYIVMEYIEGSDLAQVIKDQGKLDARLTIDVGLAVAGALEALYEAGIIHRDIKPANVMIDKQGEIKLADFGIAKVVGYETMTMTGQAAMTMAYAAPEVWDDSSPFGKPSHKSDLYAMGVLLYQCVTGATPFTGNFGALYKAHTDTPPDMSTVPASTPPSLRALIRRCLEKHQEDRPRDASECVALLKAAQAELEAGPTVEPRQFGPWLVETPHATQPWAWVCSHETRHETATVEIHFSDDLDFGATLRRAVAVNAKLTAFGAERLIESNRLLLRPEEAWSSPPPGRFQFWVAREEHAASPPTAVTAEMARKAAADLHRLLAAAAAGGVGLALNDNLTLDATGSPHLQRPGIVTPADADPTASAIEFLRAQPLDAEATALLASATTLEAIAGPLAGDPTVLLSDTPTTMQTIVGGKPVGDSETIVTPQVHPAATHAASGKVTMQLDRVNTSDTSSDYELKLHNGDSQPVDAALSASDPSGALAITLPRGVLVAPGATERLSINVSASKPRKIGGKRTSRFTIIASGGGIGEPPLTAEGEFEDKPSPMAMFALAGVAAVVLLAVVATVALGSGGGDDKQSNGGSPTDKSASAPDVAATMEPKVVPTVEPTPVPPTPTPEPPPPPTPTPVPPPPPAPVVAPAPVVVPAAPVVVPQVQAPAPTPVPPPPPTPVPAAPAASGGTFSIAGFSLNPNSPTIANGGNIPSASCNPSSIYAWVNFSNLTPPKTFSSTWTRNGASISGQQTFTQTQSSGQFFQQIMNSPNALAPGSYTYSMSIDGRVVVSGSFTMTC